FGLDRETLRTRLDQLGKRIKSTEYVEFEDELRELCRSLTQTDSTLKELRIDASQTDLDNRKQDLVRVSNALASKCGLKTWEDLLVPEALEANVEKLEATDCHYLAVVLHQMLVRDVSHQQENDKVIESIYVAAKRKYEKLYESNNV